MATGIRKTQYKFFCIVIKRRKQVRHDNRKAGGEEKHGKMQREQTRQFEIMAWSNTCIRNDWWDMRQKDVDRLDDRNIWQT